MSLDGALSIAVSGLSNVNARLALVSNNVANASTPDYSTEVGNQEALVAGSMPLGVRTDAATRAVDLALQQSAFHQDTTVATLTTTTAALRAIDALQGTPGQSNDLPALLGKVQSTFSALLGDPSSQPLQTAVLFAATALTGGINGLSEGYRQQRQIAQSDIVTQVANANADLARIWIVKQPDRRRPRRGQSSADLENLRDGIVHSLGGILGIRTLAQVNGDLLITTTSGSQLPTRATTGPLATSDVVIGAGASHAGGGIPGILLNGIDLTPQLQDGRLGADIALRDTTLPTFQGELDEFSQSLATRFDAQGLTLFTDPNGAVPVPGGPPAQLGYIGFASEIQVNPAVSTTPSLLRDGTHDVAGSPSGASAFTANVAGGPAGFTAMISRVLNFALGFEAQAGVAQPPDVTSGLGPDGTLRAPYAAPATLADHATSLASAQSAVSADATTRLSIEQSVQATLTSRLTTQAGVNMDTEMSNMIQLQNAYGANARIIAAVQTLFNQLLQAIR